MVLGLRSNTRKGPSVQFDLVINIQEIKPWPPSQSLRTLSNVVIQWENGGKNSGITNQVVPLLGDAGDGRIEFNESFKLHVTLVREMPIKGGDGENFQKNCVEFNLYEPRRDKTVKGQLLGTAVLDLAEYGVVRESLSITAPINCKRMYRNTTQPLLFLQILPVEKNRTTSSSKDSLTRETSMDRTTLVDCISQYSEEAEVASYTTDDEISSHSSQAVGSPPHKENTATAENTSVSNVDQEQVSERKMDSVGSSSHSSSTDLTSDLAWISKKISSRNPQSLSAEVMDNEEKSCIKVSDHENEVDDDILENVVDGIKDATLQMSSREDRFDIAVSQENFANVDDRANHSSDSALNHHQFNDTSSSHSASLSQNGFQKDETRECLDRNHKGRITDEKEQEFEDVPLNGFSQVEVKLENGLASSTSAENSACGTDFLILDKSKHGKSVRSSPDSNKRNGSIGGSEQKEARLDTKETENQLSESKVKRLERRINELEEELREAAAIEISLYSIVSEHGSSITKVHAPARRLSRLYFHACRHNLNSRRGSAAKSIVSGLVLVAKACGHDVPRLTFWLSNSVILRSMISRSPISMGPVRDTNETKKSAPLKWESFPSKVTRSALKENSGDWQNPLTFTDALEELETWIFSRIVESIWWQTFTPHMQSDATRSIHTSMDSNSSNLYQRTSSLSDQQPGNFSLELWKKAFRDSFERICPVRAGGHECGCLPLLSKLIMEQLIARLDVAMFNAILRESADDIPTDPVSDPISDAEVLPIPSGKASFGAGAQLKNAIGHWSRWLTDLFGIDDSESLDDDETSKSFHLLNALSDLMMLPKDMLLSQTIRKEVCPTFGTPLIRRILSCFIPDEFCPDPIPRVVLEALESEDPYDSEEGCIMIFPCAAAVVAYWPPTAFSVEEHSGHPSLRRNQSSLLKKSQTSDDELDELDSPLKSIHFHLPASPSPSSSREPSWISDCNESQNTLRYQLLREVWMNSE